MAVVFLNHGVLAVRTDSHHDEDDGALPVS